MRLIASVVLICACSAFGNAEEDDDRELAPEQWGEWTPTQFDSGDKRVRGWTSYRVVNVEDYAVGANVLPTYDGVECQVSYHVVEPATDNDSGWLRIGTGGPLQRVRRYDGLPQARANCRRAVEAKAGLEAVPVRDSRSPSDNAPATTSDGLSDPSNDDEVRDDVVDQDKKV